MFYREVGDLGLGGPALDRGAVHPILLRDVLRSPKAQAQGAEPPLAGLIERDLAQLVHAGLAESAMQKDHCWKGAVSRRPAESRV